MAHATLKASSSGNCSRQVSALKPDFSTFLASANTLLDLSLFSQRITEEFTCGIFVSSGRLKNLAMSSYFAHARYFGDGSPDKGEIPILNIVKSVSTNISSTECDGLIIVSASRNRVSEYGVIKSSDTLSSITCLLGVTLSSIKMWWSNTDR